MKKIVLTLILLFSLVTPIYPQTPQEQNETTFKALLDSGNEKLRKGDYRGALQDYTKAG